MGGARPAARPPARVQDVQGRRRRAAAVCRRGGALVPAHAPGSKSGSSTSRPTCSRASRPRDVHAAFLRAVGAEAGAARRPRPRRPDPGQRRRRRRRSWSTSCRASVASRSASSPAALVERLEVVVRFLADPRAVQAGPRRPRAGHELRRHRDHVDRRRSCVDAEDGGLDALARSSSTATTDDRRPSNAERTRHRSRS